jgi:hypothetical protein
MLPSSRNVSRKHSSLRSVPFRSRVRSLSHLFHQSSGTTHRTHHLWTAILFRPKLAAKQFTYSGALNPVGFPTSLTLLQPNHIYCIPTEVSVSEYYNKRPICFSERNLCIGHKLVKCPSWLTVARTRPTIQRTHTPKLPIHSPSLSQRQTKKGHEIILYG